MTDVPGSSRPRDPGDELVEEVDEYGQVLRVVTRREMRAGRLRHRAVFVLVCHPDGRLLVHQRSPHKDIWPSWWDVGVGGVVSVGETYEAAAARELAEEIGVVLGPGGGALDPLDDGVALPYTDADVALIGRCFRVITDGPFSFDDGEVVQARFVDLTELRTMIRDVPFLPDGLAFLRRFADPDGGVPTL